jgi:hypothetical protein
MMDCAAIESRIRALRNTQAQKAAQKASLSQRKSELERDLQNLYATISLNAEIIGRAAGIESAWETVSNLQRDYERTKDLRNDQSQVYIRLNDASLREQKGLKFYSAVLDRITESYVSQLEATLNDVYRYVFQNPSKSIALALEDRYNKKVLQLRLLNQAAGESNEESLDDSGFSVSIVLGTVLLVYYIMYNNLERVIFFDESFTGLSDETATRFFALLRVFIEQMGFDFMLISHETRFVEYADRSYFVRGGKFLLEKREEQ